MPSSSRWSNTSGTVRAHCPDPMQRFWSTCTFIGAFLPGDRQIMHAVDLHIVLEADRLERRRQPEPGQPAEEGGIDHLQLVARQRLAEALVDAVAEGEVFGRVAREIELVGLGEHALVAIGGGEEE